MQGIQCDEYYAYRTIISKISSDPFLFFFGDWVNQARGDAQRELEKNLLPDIRVRETAKFKVYSEILKMALQERDALLKEFPHV